MRNTKNILRHELIGLQCEVIKSKNKACVGIKGKIIDETMKTVMIDKNMIPKNGTTFRIRLEDKNVDIEGDYLVSRPEDRIKKKIKKW